MLDLATNYTGKPIRLKDVAKRQEISDKYLEQIISILNKAGFVRTRIVYAVGIDAYSLTNAAADDIRSVAAGSVVRHSVSSYE